MDKNEDDENGNIRDMEEEQNRIPKIVFRNMNYFMTTQTKKGKHRAMENYINSDDDRPGKGVHFTLHYSTGGYILLYLMRVSPFRDVHIKFQSGSFDDPNRLINSLDELLTIISDSKDNRELIPEFFTSCDYFYNLNYIYYGFRTPQNIVINDLRVSPFFQSIEKYIYYNRLLLNNNKDKTKLNFPKCQLYNWINLVFGHKQFPASKDLYNKFGKYTYRQEKNLIIIFEKHKKNGCKDEELMKTIFTKKSLILNFGQCPLQLFQKDISEPKKFDSSPIKNHGNKLMDLHIKNI